MWSWFLPRKSRSDLQKLDTRLPRELSLVIAGAGVPRFRQVLPRLWAELERARRYKRSLALAVFTDDRHHGSGAGQPRPARPGTNGSGAHAPHLAGADGLYPAMLASLLREAMRETDIVTFAAKDGRCFVVMPEVASAEARQAVGRLQDLCVSRLAFPVRAGVAAFPQDGWTLEELIRHAEDNAQPTVEKLFLVKSAKGGEAVGSGSKSS